MKSFTIKQLLEVGVHYGHDVRRWNPKMAPYIFRRFNNVHIIDLRKTAPMLHNALKQIKETVSRGGRVLFVGTKPQAAPIIKEYAEKCGQHYVNHRWLGGILTNWKTVSQSINTLVKLEKLMESGMEGYTKKEQLSFKRQAEKLELALGGIRNMGGLPNIIFIIDAKKEHTAVAEANKLNIPVVAVVDTNGDPEAVKYPIPGNDDALKAIELYCDLVSSAIISGLESEVQDKNVAAKTATEGMIEDTVKSEEVVSTPDSEVTEDVEKETINSASAVEDTSSIEKA